MPARAASRSCSAGPLLHRLGEAFIPDLGGCRIGDRPINYHLDILRQFGAVVDKTDNGIHIRAPRRLQGTKIALPYPSVGATEQLLLTAVRAEGITELANAAIEPEIMDLINVLQKMGAIISVDTDRVIRIEGVDRLFGFQHTALSDRIEAASWASAALATGGDIFVRGATQPEMTTFLNTFRKVGGEFAVDDDGIRFFHPGGDLRSITARDGRAPRVHDGLAAAARRGAHAGQGPVDRARDGLREPVRVHRRARRHGRDDPGLQGVPGRSAVPVRAAQLLPLGRHLGPTPLAAADIEVPDLRGGFSHLIAALTAKGTSSVRGHQPDRPRATSTSPRSSRRWVPSSAAS